MPNKTENTPKNIKKHQTFHHFFPKSRGRYARTLWLVCLDHLSCCARVSPPIVPVAPQLLHIPRDWHAPAAPQQFCELPPSNSASCSKDAAPPTDVLCAPPRSTCIHGPRPSHGCACPCGRPSTLAATGFSGYAPFAVWVSTLAKDLPKALVHFWTRVLQL